MITANSTSSELASLVSQLPETYQPIYGHPELSTKVSRTSKNRLAQILEVHSTLKKKFDRPLRVLDLGCAQGYFCMNLAEQGSAITGVDFLQENIAVCNALAVENPKFNVRFEHERIENVLESLSGGEYDFVLGLSIFHHIIHEHGIEKVRNWISVLAPKIEFGIFEFAQASEPPYWAVSQPEESRMLLNDFAFAHELSRHATHLSEIKRPLYFASNHYWYLDGEAEKFDTWTFDSHSFTANVFQGTRRYFFGEQHMVKVFRLDDPALNEPNQVEIQREIDFLVNPPAGFPAPRLITQGRNETETWLIRGTFSGDLLSGLILDGRAYDAQRLLSDVLEQLCTLEVAQLYHTDLRVWNVLVGTDGSSSLIDYGSISGQMQDMVWPHNIYLAFWIFVYEVVTGEIEPPFPQRQTFISPFNLPEPFQQWALRIWSSPVKQWSFKLLLKEFKKIKKGDKKTLDKDVASVDETSTALWVRTMEEYINTLNASVRNLNRHRAVDPEQIKEYEIKLQESDRDRAARLEQIKRYDVWLKEANSDRAARLEQIKQYEIRLQESQSDRAALLDQIKQYDTWLKESEIDRAARLDQIKQYAIWLKEAQIELQASRAELKKLKSSLIYKVGRRLGMFK